MIPSGLPKEAVLLHYVIQLASKYPDLPMELDVSASEYPNSSVSDDAISLDIPGTLVAMVCLPNNSVVPAFTLGLVCLIGSHDASRDPQ